MFAKTRGQSSDCIGLPCREELGGFLVQDLERKGLAKEEGLPVPGEKGWLFLGKGKEEEAACCVQRGRHSTWGLCGRRIPEGYLGACAL